MHADQVPGGIVTKLDECSQDVYRQRAAVMVNVVFAASGLLLVSYLNMMWGTYVSIYWRKFEGFWWQDHWKRGYELVDELKLSAI
jgi:hypothetical protein